MPRFCGWWGGDPEVRFQMPEAIALQAGAGGWQLSNCPILTTAPLRASLELFGEAGGLVPLRTKSLALTGLLVELCEKLSHVTVITPGDPEQRGCQLSLQVRGGAGARDLKQHLAGCGVVCDVREPDVVRVAPVPLYNTFVDVWHLAAALESFGAPHLKAATQPAPRDLAP